MRIKRTLFMVVTLALLATATAATALAQAPAPPAGQAAAQARLHQVHGLVTATSDRGFRVRDVQGNLVGVVVNDKTRFRLAGQKGADFSDLKVGDRVLALGRRSTAGVFTARLVNIEARRPKVHAAAGEVTAVTASSLTIHSARGDSVTFVLNDKTRIIPKDASIKVGDKVGVVGARDPGDKAITARVVTIKRLPAPKPL